MVPANSNEVGQYLSFRLGADEYALEILRGVLLKAGFTQEGLARAYLRINGIWEDHLLFGLVSPAPASEHRGEDVLV